MTRSLRNAYNRLKAAGCPVFERDDAKGRTFHISAEQADENSPVWADYYGRDYPWYDPRIDDILKPLGLYADWDNPASLSVWER